MSRPDADGRLNIVIATPLELALVDRLRAELPDVQVHYEPELLPPVRYPGDHRGSADFRRSPRQQARWLTLLADAEVTFGIPGDDPQQLHRLVRTSTELRFVQATAAGAGQQVRASRLSADDLERVAIASTSGVHAGPLAEFALLGILAFARGLPRLQHDRDARTWDHYPTRDVAGRTVVIVGVGAIGERIATLTKALRMRVVGVNTSGHGSSDAVDEYATAEQLPELATRADALVITLPATTATKGMVNTDVLSALPLGAIVVNVGRGSVIDESALVDRLRAGHLAGAALDVTEQEPLPQTSALWQLPNVILSPHTAALSPHENERIVALFIDNVHRLTAGSGIVNRIIATQTY